MKMVARIYVLVLGLCMAGVQLEARQKPGGKEYTPRVLTKSEQPQLASMSMGGVIDYVVTEMINVYGQLNYYNNKVVLRLPKEAQVLGVAINFGDPGAGPFWEPLPAFSYELIFNEDSWIGAVAKHYQVFQAARDVFTSAGKASELERLEAMEKSKSGVAQDGGPLASFLASKFGDMADVDKAWLLYVIKMFLLTKTVMTYGTVDRKMVEAGQTGLFEKTMYLDLLREVTILSFRLFLTIRDRVEFNDRNPLKNAPQWLIEVLQDLSGRFGKKPSYLKEMLEGIWISVWRYRHIGYTLEGRMQRIGPGVYGLRFDNEGEARRFIEATTKYHDFFKTSLREPDTSLRAFCEFNAKRSAKEDNFWDRTLLKLDEAGAQYTYFGLVDKTSKDNVPDRIKDIGERARTQDLPLFEYLYLSPQEVSEQEVAGHRVLFITSRLNFSETMSLVAAAALESAFNVVDAMKEKLKKKPEWGGIDKELEDLGKQEDEETAFMSFAKHPNESNDPVIAKLKEIASDSYENVELKIDKIRKLNPDFNPQWPEPEMVEELVGQDEKGKAAFATELGSQININDEALKSVENLIVSSGNFLKVMKAFIGKINSLTQTNKSDVITKLITLNGEPLKKHMMNAVDEASKGKSLEKVEGDALDTVVNKVMIDLGLHQIKDLTEEIFKGFMAKVGGIMKDVDADLAAKTELRTRLQNENREKIAKSSAVASSLAAKGSAAGKWEYPESPFSALWRLAHDFMAGFAKLEEFRQERLILDQKKAENDVTKELAVLDGKIVRATRQLANREIAMAANLRLLLNREKGIYNSEISHLEIAFKELGSKKKGKGALPLSVVQQKSFKARIGQLKEDLKTIDENLGKLTTVISKVTPQVAAKNASEAVETTFDFIWSEISPVGATDAKLAYGAAFEAKIKSGYQKIENTIGTQKFTEIKNSLIKRLASIFKESSSFQRYPTPFINIASGLMPLNKKDTAVITRYATKK